MPMACPTGAPVRLARSRSAWWPDSWRTSQPMVRCVCTTPLGSAVVPEVYPISAAPSGSTAQGAGDRVGRAQVVEADPVVAGGLPHHDHVLEVREPVTDGGELGQVVALAHGGHDDQRPGPTLAQDEADLLGPVEVDDGDKGDAEHGAGIEGDGGLDPVGQLEGHHVARSEAERSRPPATRSASS